MAEFSATPEVAQTCRTKITIAKKIAKIFDIPKLPFHSPTNVPYNKEAKGSPLTRPCLIKPSDVTTTFVIEIFKDFMSDGQINVELIKKNLSFCPPKEDLLLIEDEYHYNILQRAVLIGNFRLLEVLIDHGCNVNGIKSEEVCGRGLKHCPHEHVGALHLACFLGHLDVVRYLLEKGADPCLRMKVSKLQPGICSGSISSSEADIISRCGHREAVFYAVLVNNVPIIKLLLQTRADQGEGEAVADTADDKYLLPLACHIGAVESLEYLLEQYPQYVNTKFPEGRPLLLWALHNSNPRLIRLLLERDCDIRVLDKYLRPTGNLLNHLFQPDTIQQLKTPEGLSDIVKNCLKKGIDVNSRRKKSKSTPLHDLLESLNNVVSIRLQDRRNPGYDVYLRKLDKELMDCIQLLVNHGADLLMKDCYDDIPLQNLLKNRNHVQRYVTATTESICGSVAQALEADCYGLENILKVIKILVDRGCIDKQHKLPIVNQFINNISGITVRISKSKLQILKKDSVFETHKEILRIILDAGADPNIPSELTRKLPLFELLDHIASFPYTFDHIIDLELAQKLTVFATLLLSHGAHTETCMRIHTGGIGMILNRQADLQMFSCFDMLYKALLSLQNNPLPAEYLQIIHQLVVLLLQHGASTCVIFILHYSTEYYKGRNVPHPEPTIFFLYLIFGMFNLTYVNDGPWYHQLFKVVYSHVDHQNLYDVLWLAMS